MCVCLRVGGHGRLRVCLMYMFVCIKGTLAVEKWAEDVKPLAPPYSSDRAHPSSQI